MEEILREIDFYLEETVRWDGLPGAVLAVGDEHGVLMKKAYGNRRLFPYQEEMTADTVFDLASVTKVTAVWPAVLKLVEEGKIGFETRVGQIDEEMADTPVGVLTLEQLLVHTSGMSERTFLRQYGTKKREIYEGICREKLEYETGTKVAYSNRGFILLGFLIEKLTGMPLEEYVKKAVWEPTGMMGTMYLPLGDFGALEEHAMESAGVREAVAEAGSGRRMRKPIAPTEFDVSEKDYLCGRVHDENARVLGGVAGHAGVFSDVDDLCRFCGMLIRGGKAEGRTVLRPELIERSFRNYTFGLNEGRGYAWQKCPDAAEADTLYRHLGYTGTALWVDIRRKYYAVLLTNRVHPDRERYQSQIQQVRKFVQTKLQDADWEK